jgi:hypothetical protein
MKTKKKQPKPKKTTMFLRNIPPDVKRKFKSLCASQGITMNDQIVNIMEQMTRWT